MGTNIVDLLSTCPVVSEVLENRGDPQRHAPIGYVLRFTHSRESLLLIEADQDTDEVIISIVDSCQIGVGYSYSEAVSRVMSGASLKSVSKCINMQEYMDAIELCSDDSPVVSGREKAHIFRFEVAASMVFFRHGFLVEAD